MFLKNTVQIISLLLFSLLFAKVEAGYQMWKQCDPRWAQVQLGFSSDTICSAGCLMTSVTMAVTSLPTWIDPPTMNQWLKEHGGYVSGDNFVWGSVGPFGIQFGGVDTVTDRIGLHLLANHFVIANVDGGNHWVLVTGAGSGFYNINDPGYNRGSVGAG